MGEAGNENGFRFQKLVGCVKSHAGLIGVVWDVELRDDRQLALCFQCLTLPNQERQPLIPFKVTLGSIGNAQIGRYGVQVAENTARSRW